MNPRITVIIPAYNRANLIGRAIESALAQTYRPLEILVIDDGSKDNTAAVVKKYPEVRYVAQENQGAAQARNNGVNLAGGEYIAFLDSDDLWVNTKLELQMKLLLRLQAPILAARKRYVPHDAIVATNPPNISSRYHLLTFGRQRKRTWIVPSTVLFKKDYFQSFGGFDRRLKIAEDWDLWLKMAYERPIPRMNAVLTYNFVTQGSLTENRLEKYLYDLEVIKKWDPRHDDRLAMYTYRKWCAAFTFTHLQKLLRHSGKETARTFWLKLKEELPLPRYVTVLGNLWFR